MTNYAPPTPAPPVLPPQPRRRWWKAGWVLPVAAVLALLAGVGIGGGAGKTVTVAGPTTTATVAAPTETVTVTATPTVVKVVATKTQTVRVTFTPPPPKQYGDGTYVVGTDIQAGVYKTSGSDTCYWARLSSLDGDLTHILANHLGAGMQTVEIQSSDKAFTVQGCTFGRIG